MLTRKEYIEDGDFAVIYESFNNYKLIQVKKGDIFQNRNGAFKHDSFIGKRFGCKITAIDGRGTSVLLALQENLWKLCMAKRTQILFSVDCAMVLYHLDIRPGSVVIESGTGSGSLTSSFARAVAPHGHIHTFEFNAERAKKAAIDFVDNKIDHLITTRHRDVCERGFPFFPEGVDAVFLDLPKPWVAIDDAHRSLRPQGRFCSFSPCIEQVQRSCIRLAELRYEDIITIECLIKPFDVYHTDARVIDIYEMAEEADSKALDRKRFLESKKAVVTEIVDGSVPDVAVVQMDDLLDNADAKRVKTEEVRDDPVVALESKQTAVVEQPKSEFLQKFDKYPNAIYLSKPVAVMRGHTGYLTFARKPASLPLEEAV